MSVDFRHLTSELRSLVAQLEDRCTTAEAQLEAARIQADGYRQQAERAEASLDDITTRYKNLQAALSGGDARPEAIDAQRERYLAMVRVIDECIAKLENRKLATIDKT